MLPCVGPGLPARRLLVINWLVDLVSEVHWRSIWTTLDLLWWNSCWLGRWFRVGLSAVGEDSESLKRTLWLEERHILLKIHCYLCFTLKWNIWICMKFGCYIGGNFPSTIPVANTLPCWSILCVVPVGYQLFPDCGVGPIFQIEKEEETFFRTVREVFQRVSFSPSLHRRQGKASSTRHSTVKHWSPEEVWTSDVILCLSFSSHSEWSMQFWLGIAHS